MNSEMQRMSMRSGFGFALLTGLGLGLACTEGETGSGVERAEEVSTDDGPDGAGADADGQGGSGEGTSGQGADGQSSDGQGSDGQSADGQGSSGQSADGQGSGGQSADGQGSSGQGSSGQSEQGSEQDAQQVNSDGSGGDGSGGADQSGETRDDADGVGTDDADAVGTDDADAVAGMGLGEQEPLDPDEQQGQADDATQASDPIGTPPTPVERGLIDEVAVAGGCVDASDDPKTRTTASGANGTWQDTCDEQGDLLEQVCEWRFGCDAPLGADCAPSDYPTGNVTQSPVDCAGKCVDGVCDLACLAPGDVLRVVQGSTPSMELSDVYVFEDPETELRYRCIASNDTRDGNCWDFLPGDPFEIVATSELCAEPPCPCTADQPLLSEANGCDYSCRAMAPEDPVPVVPEEECHRVAHDTYETPSCENSGARWQNVSCELSGGSLVVSADLCEDCGDQAYITAVTVSGSDCYGCTSVGGSLGLSPPSEPLGAGECAPFARSIPLEPFHTGCMLIHLTTRAGDEPDVSSDVTSGRIACRCDQRSGECVTCSGDECLDP